MFDMKANNVKVGDKLYTRGGFIAEVIGLDTDSHLYPYLIESTTSSTLYSVSEEGNAFSGSSSVYDIVAFAPGYGNQVTMNKPHKHKDLIIAWANGAEIEFFDDLSRRWYYTDRPVWGDHTQYRIKPEPKPDVVKYMFVEAKPSFCNTTNDNNLKLTFCGETGKLKSAEVVS